MSVTNQELCKSMIAKAKEMLEKGEVGRVLAWREGILSHLPEPAFFVGPHEAGEVLYNEYCGANLSKFLIGSAEKTLVFLRMCDSYSLNLLLKENRVTREGVYIVGIGCLGIHDENGRMVESCKSCTKTRHVVYDELMLDGLRPAQVPDPDRFLQVKSVDGMSLDEKYLFWQKELGRCIRCNACRNICPTCHCKKCVFDSEKYDSRQNVNASSFEEQMFHIIRAYHVAGRCTDCGQCSRVCPQKIPLYILNRKFIKDINEFFGEYAAGEDSIRPNPLVAFDAEGDPEV